MPTIEHITLTGLRTEVVIGCIGHLLEQVAAVPAECHMSAGSNKPARVVLPFGVILRGEGVEVRLPDWYDATEIVDMDAVTQLVREARAEREEAELERQQRVAGI